MTTRPTIQWFGDLLLAPLPDGRNVRVVNEVCVVLDRRQVCIPADAITDGASIPRLAWRALGWTPFTGFCRRGAVVHDMLYRGLALVGTPCLRAEADLILYWLTRDDLETYYRTVTGWLNRARYWRDRARCTAVYCAVRGFGVLAWKGQC